MYIICILSSYVRKMVSIKLIMLFSFWSPDKVCAKGRYGKNCTGRCSANCVDGACDHVDGRCVQGCNPGYQGTTCSNGIFISRKTRHFYTGNCANVNLLLIKVNLTTSLKPYQIPNVNRAHTSSTLNHC